MTALVYEIVNLVLYVTYRWGGMKETDRVFLFMIHVFEYKVRQVHLNPFINAD